MCASQGVFVAGRNNFDRRRNIYIYKYYPFGSLDRVAGPLVNHYFKLQLGFLLYMQVKSSYGLSGAGACANVCVFHFLVW